jgi:hypothetical protein
LLRLNENLENEVTVLCLVGQVVDTIPNDSERRLVNECSGGTREVALPAVSVVANHVSGLPSLQKHFLLLQTLCHKNSSMSF